MIDDADNVEMIRGPDEVKAQKRHKCDECQRVIYKGERYIQCVFRDPGHGAFNNYKRCHHCHKSWAWLNKKCGGSCFFGMEEDLRQHFEEGSYQMKTPEIMELGRLVVGVRRKWQRFDSTGLMCFPKLIGDSK
jgi:hypothetical protein